MSLILGRSWGGGGGWGARDPTSFPGLFPLKLGGAGKDFPAPPNFNGKSPGNKVARDPPLVGLLLSKQPTIFRRRKRHDNILALKAIVEKPTFLKFVFL